MLDDIQAHCSTLYQLGSNTGASFQTMRDFYGSLSKPRFSIVTFIGSLSADSALLFSATSSICQRAVPFQGAEVSHSSFAQAKTPGTCHVDTLTTSASTCSRLESQTRNLVAAVLSRNLFPSLFLPKIRVVETRSATQIDRVYNYRKWQQRWAPDITFPCCCVDVDDRTTFRAHSHAVILNEFHRINADIDADIMSASMKDQYFGDVDKLQQRFALQLCKLARRWKVQGSSFDDDSRPVLSELFDQHRSNVQDQAHWTSESLQPTARALTTWVVIPADNFPSRAHVICPALFSTLLLKTLCTGDVFATCKESAASFRAEVVTLMPPRLQQRYAWGLQLQAPLPTARILPKPTKDWLKARPIISSPHGLCIAHKNHLSGLGGIVVRGPRRLHTVGVTRFVRFLHVHSHRTISPSSSSSSSSI